MKNKVWNIDLVKNLFKEHGFILLEDEYINSHTPMKFKDKDGYMSTISVSNLQTGQGYYICHKTNPYSIDNIKKFIKDNGCNSEILSDKYVSNTTKLQIKCNCGKTFTKDWAHIYREKDCRCNQCIREKVSTEQKCSHEYILSVLHQNKLEYVSGKYTNNQSKLLCKNADGYLVFAQICNLRDNKSPIVFSLKFNKENFDFNMKKYIENNNLDCTYIRRFNTDTNYNNIIIEVKCSCGNLFYPKLSNFLNDVQHQRRCEICSKKMSNYELKTEKWLNENQIKYYKQYRFDNCRVKRSLPFDFYLPEINVCIEVDGEQHFREYNNFGKEAYKRCVKYDKIKTKYCKENNIKLLRIPYWHFYKDKYEKILLINILQD